MLKPIINHLKRFIHCFHGLRDGVLYDSGIRGIFIYVFFILGCTFFFFGPLTSIATLLLLLTCSIMVCTEFINTSIEKVLDATHPEKSELVRLSKDFAAAAGIFVGVFLLILVYFIATGKI